MTEPQPQVVIVGAGHAAGALAAQLRQFGLTAPITLIGAEEHLPYERPPLSKAWLAAGQDRESITLRPAEFYADQDITVRLGTTVAGIDCAARRLFTSTGEALRYDYLVIATGARSRRLSLPGRDARNVLYLRNQHDAARLRAALDAAERMVLIGGGFIGLEVAAAARARQIDVTVLEQLPRILGRVASAALADFVQRRHVAAGVRFRTSTTVTQLLSDADCTSTAIYPHGNRVRAVRTAAGDEVGCDLVVVGIGAEPVDELAAAADIVCDNGIVVDEQARTSDPHVFAIGDVTSRPVLGSSARIRLESVPSTTEQARQAAAAITGRTAPRNEVPWFWSDQLDMKIQIAGIYDPESTTVVRSEADATTITHDRGGAVVAIETVNRPGDFLLGKKIIARRQQLDPSLLHDDSLALRDLIAVRPVTEGG